VLKLENVSVRYGRAEAVAKISLEVAGGEAVGLVGPNGAGKTTILSAVAGLLRPAAGTIAFDGTPIGREAPEMLVRRGLALVPEGRQIFATLTVEENLRLPTYSRAGVDKDAAIERELERFPILRTYFKQHAGRLSGGEQQQLAIARALLTGPRLLMLDEPSLGLAPKMVDVVFAALEGLREEGVTVLLVEQNATRTIAFADRTYVISSGRVVASGAREELQHSDTVRASYLGTGIAAVDAS
jgi:branched-chain amino acid transport system ATP-binding protein